MKFASPLPVLYCVVDCQTFEAVSSRDGHRLWRFSDNASYGGGPDVMNFYTGQFIDDVDGDRIPDVVAVHGGDPFAPPGALQLVLI